MADKPYVSPSKLKRFFMGLLGEKLNTKEEITANTDVDKFAGAMAMKEIYEEVNDSLASYNKIKQAINIAVTCEDVESNKNGSASIDLTSYGFKNKPIPLLVGNRQLQSWVSTITTTTLNLGFYNPNSKTISGYAYYYLIELE